MENKTTKKPLFCASFLASLYNFLTCHVFADEYKIYKQILGQVQMAVVSQSLNGKKLVQSFILATRW